MSYLHGLLPAEIDRLNDRRFEEMGSLIRGNLTLTPRNVNLTEEPPIARLVKRMEMERKMAQTKNDRMLIQGEVQKALGRLQRAALAVLPAKGDETLADALKVWLRNELTPTAEPEPVPEA